MVKLLLSKSFSFAMLKCECSEYKHATSFFTEVKRNKESCFQNVCDWLENPCVTVTAQTDTLYHLELFFSV